MLTDKQLNELIRVLLAERRKRRQRRRLIAENRIDLPHPTSLPDGEQFFRVFTIDYRFTMLDLATALYGDEARSTALRTSLKEVAILCGAEAIGKARVNRGDGEAQVDLAYSVKDWDTFRARLLSALSKEPAQ